MLTRSCLALIALCLTGLTLAAIAGHHPWSGSTLISVTSRHGLDMGDLPALAAWLIGVSCCVAIWRRRD